MVPRKETQKRKRYEQLRKSFLQLMDGHVLDVLATMKPSEAFDNFIVLNNVATKLEIEQLYEKYPETYEQTERSGCLLALDKFKKTYKNRYFLIATNTSGKEN